MLKNLRQRANFRIEQITEIQQQCFCWSEGVIKYDAEERCRENGICALTYII